MTAPGTLVHGPFCAVPAHDTERIQLGHGSGGRLSADLVREHFLPRFGNPALLALGDGAVVPGADTIAVSTDSFVVRPLEFPGGNIGHLAVHGTLNDVAMMGATPRYLTAGFVLEEGLPFDVLGRILDAMAGAARAAGIPIIAGDTKVVERGKADGLYINTTGIGVIEDGFRPGPDRARIGDAILVSGPIGRHGIAVLAVRDGLTFEAEVTSDTASLHPLVAALRAAAGTGVHVLRDPTRGGVASALNEIAASSRVGMRLREEALPVPEPVAAACAMLGLDPLYVANEGMLVAIVAADVVAPALRAMRAHPLGKEAVVIGEVIAGRPGLVRMATGMGGERIVDLLPGDQLPRIC